MTISRKIVTGAATLAGLLLLSACGEAGEVGPKGDDTSIHAEENPDGGEDGPTE